MIIRSRVSISVLSLAVLLMGASGRSLALRKLQIRSIICAALVNSGLIDNGAEHMVEPTNINRNIEQLLQTAGTNTFAPSIKACKTASV